MTVSIDASLLVGFLLAMARATAWVWVSPPFAGSSVPGRIKVGLAAVLSLPIASQLAGHSVPLDTPSLIMAILSQVAIGIVLGFIGVLVFAAFQAAGSVIDLFGGYSMAQIFDPQTGSQSSLFGRFYSVLAVTLLFAINGHLLLVRGFMTSFEAMPIEGLQIGAIGRSLTMSLGLLFVAALEIAAPIIAALFLTDVALGLLSRAAPQMQVFLLGLPVKLLLTLVIMGVALPILPGAVSSLVERVITDGLGLLRTG